MFAGAHGREAHGSVVLPGSGGDHQVDVVAVAQAEEVGLAAVVERGRGLARLFHPALGAVEKIGVGVAHGLDLDVVQAEAHVHVVGAAVADPHEAEAKGAPGGLRSGSLH